MQADRFDQDRVALTPLTDYLTKDFGVKFDLESTGPDSTAIISDFADGLRVLLTDPEYQQATLIRSGWMVGVYDVYEDSEDPLVFVSLNRRLTYQETARLVRAALAAGAEMQKDE